jgi:O-antigen/teichoic acid export membrane protein
LPAKVLRSNHGDGYDEGRVSDSRAPVSVAHGSIVLFAASIVRAAGFFVAALILARGLGPAGRGSVAFVTVAALLTGRIAKIGVGEATTVFAAQRPGARPTLLANLVAFSLTTALGLGTLVVAGLYVIEAEPAGNGRTQLALLLAGSVASTLVDDCFLVGCGRLRHAAAISASGGWVYVASLTTAALTVGLDVDSALVAWAATHVVWSTALTCVGWRTAGLSRPSLRLLAESVRFGVRAWVGSASLLVNARLDQILVGVIASEVTLGLYAVAVNVGEALLFLPTAIATSLLPTVARERDVTGAERTLRTFRAAAVLSFASIAGAAAVGGFAIPDVFGAAYSGSVAPFMWLLPGTLGFTALSIFSNSLLALRAPGWSSFGSVAALGAGLALDLALIPSFGASGAAAAASAAFLAGGATAAILYRRRTAFAWSEIVPTLEDVGFLRLVAARVVPRGR